MADLKISQLANASTALAGTEVLPIVQSSSTVKVTVANLTAGRAVSALSGTFNVGTYAAFPAVTVAASSETGRTYQMGMITGGKWALYENLGPTKLIDVDSTGNTSFYGGNLIQGTAGKGINFTANANAPGMTSELLNWYEEGTFTPTIEGTTTVGTATYATQLGSYTRIGRQVYVSIALDWSAGTGAGVLRIGGLPFTSSSTALTPGLSIGIIDSVALTVGTYPTAFVRTNSTQISLRQSPTGGGSSTDVSYDAAGYISLSGFYIV